jgi:hypothetical protein
MRLVLFLLGTPSYLKGSQHHHLNRLTLWEPLTEHTITSHKPCILNLNLGCYRTADYLPCTGLKHEASQIVETLQEKDKVDCMIRDETNHSTYHKCLCEYEMFRVAHHNFYCFQSYT